MELKEIIVCPMCKAQLETVSLNGYGKGFRCATCNKNYPIEAGIPNLTPDHLKGIVYKDSPEMSEEAVKGYYIETERYDWVVDTKYPEKLFHILRERAIINNIKKYAKGKISLDLGCGTGLITRHIDFEHTIGVDLNRWAIAKASTHVEDNVQFIAGDAENLPLASNTFDVVVCTDVLEHLLEPEKAASDIYRVLKPGGVLVGTVPSKNLIWKYRKAITTTCPVCEPFHNNFSKREIQLLFGKFEIISLRRGALWLEWLFAVRKA
jgi:ubiquinone/menaquinone biosynthesis C-methylase UbiE/uncharacterized protein YbaR (Trm112 family)